MIGFRRALVTGGAGFIGSRLVTALLARGHDVTVLDNLSAGRCAAVDPRARLIIGDVRDPLAVEDALSSIDCVYHLAAQVTIRGSFDRFYEDLDTNVMGTANLLRRLPSGAVKWFVLASSMGVYADAPAPRPIDESHPTTPISPYGIGKLAAEQVATQILGMRGVPLTIVRYFNTFGPGQAFTPYVGALTIFITRLLAGKPPVIFGDGEQQRDFVHVDDIVAGTMAGVGRATGVYNLGTGRGTSLNQLAHLAIARVEPSLAPTYEAARPGELRYSVAGITAAREALGFAPSRSLEADIDEVIAEIRQRGVTS
ncbi:MAG: NAD-dependent epimerase/dehydratase family protein [Vicinamibacterales bacterium]